MDSVSLAPELSGLDQADGGESVLRTAAHEAIRTGRIPTAHPQRMWGGYGEGHVCAICLRVIAESDAEMEIQFPLASIEGDTYHLHALCCAAWEWARSPAGRNGAAWAASGPVREPSASIGDSSPDLLSIEKGDGKIRLREFDGHANSEHE